MKLSQLVPYYVQMKVCFFTVVFVGHNVPVNSILHDTLGCP